MIHLFKHSKGKLKGKFDIALVVRGKYIVGSNQGYERKSGCYNAMIAICRTLPVVGRLGSCKFQDDTFDKPLVVDLDAGNKMTFSSTKKPTKKYQPQTK
jgi:hypothetical protein